MKARLSALALICASAWIGGCRSGDDVIDRVLFEASENLEVVRLSIEFGKAVRAEYGGNYAIKDHGSAFVIPYGGARKPFTVGFELDVSVMDDQDFIELAPTRVLPNGMPIAAGYPLVEIRAPQPIHDQFDLMGYVDVLRTEWLGVAVMIGASDREKTRVFLRDHRGEAAVVAQVFGAGAQSGGIALFGNIRQLTALYLRTGKPVELRPEPEPEGGSELQFSLMPSTTWR